MYLIRSLSLWVLKLLVLLRKSCYVIELEINFSINFRNKMKLKPLYFVVSHRKDPKTKSALFHLDISLESFESIRVVT
jgi:hypothetical protein